MSNHEAKIVKIDQIHKHPNADSLGLVFIGGFQVVVRLDQFKIGDLAVYIQPDSIVPLDMPQFKFVWEKDGSGQPRDLSGDISEKWRRVTVRKFRKEWSEGILLPITDFPAIPTFLKEGDDAASILGITHWNPPEEQEESGDPSRRQSRTRPRSFKGWVHFFWNWFQRIMSLGYYDPWGNCGGTNEKAPRNIPPIYDVENFKHHRTAFDVGEEVVVTEKIHGSNARYLYQPDMLFFGSGHLYAGSRQLWKALTSSNVWRKILVENPDIEKWCREHAGYVLYGEATPTQGGFEYGHTKEHPWLYVFDIRTPDGEWLPYDDARALTAGYDLEWAPLLYHGPYDYEKIVKLVDGPTKTGASNIREGIVIRTAEERIVRGLGRAQLKMVSNKYLEKS